MNVEILSFDQIASLSICTRFILQIYFPCTKVIFTSHRCGLGVLRTYIKVNDRFKFNFGNWQLVTDRREFGNHRRKIII